MKTLPKYKYEVGDIVFNQYESNYGLILDRKIKIEKGDWGRKDIYILYQIKGITKENVSWFAKTNKTYTWYNEKSLREI